MKICRKCKESKELVEFTKLAKSPDGYNPQCKLCTRDVKNKYSRSDKGKAKKKEWYLDHLEIYSEYSKKYRVENPEKRKKTWQKFNQKETTKEYKYKWSQENPERITAASARHKAAKLKASPSWLTEDDYWLIKEIYEISSLRSKMTGVPHQVDHILPLQGNLVCGLHTPYNLQVLTAYENQSKSNSYVVS